MAKKKSSQRLKTVLKLAQLRERQAAERLAASVQSASAEQRQLQQLKTFQSDYNQQFKTQANKPIDASQLNNYLHFFNNLENALEAQHQRKELVERKLEHMRSQWQQRYSQKKNMESLIQTKQCEEEREQEKKLQRVLDDRVASNKDVL